MEPARSSAYDRLAAYINQRMRMSHIYQPLMLMELLGRSSPAPAEDIARRILGEDSSQIDYYTERVKRMVGRVLTSNGITSHAGGIYTLIGADDLSEIERDALLQLCWEKLDSFRLKRGDDVFAHRSRHRTAISGSIRYRVFTRAKGRCECCGAHEHQAALEVDHISRRTRVVPMTSPTSRRSASVATPASGTATAPTSAGCCRAMATGRRDASSVICCLQIGC